jgi:predicted NBD/HSP70 family sugar kinase
MMQRTESNRSSFVPFTAYSLHSDTMKRTREPRGGDQSGLREFNRRLILNVIRQYGPVPKAEIARITGLTAQSVSVIVNALLKEQLLRKEKKVRGQVGQPRTPIALNPHGALSIGIKIGRRSLEMVLVDFRGAVIATGESYYSAPRPRDIMKILTERIAELTADLEPRVRSRVVGIGIALPGHLSQWTEILGLSPSELSEWDAFDICAAVRELTGLPVQLWNDATAACAAEVLLGEAMTVSSALYIYIGTFIGGGLVLDGKLYAGVQGNAGAIGSMPVQASSGLGLQQLIRSGSLLHLDRRFTEAGVDGEQKISAKVRRSRNHPAYLAWRREASRGIANAIVCALSVVDFEAVVIDAMLDRDDVAEIAGDVGEALAEFDMTGLTPAVLRPGAIGPAARVLGAAILPFIINYSPDQELLVKQTMVAA